MVGVNNLVIAEGRVDTRDSQITATETLQIGSTQYEILPDDAHPNPTVALSGSNAPFMTTLTLDGGANHRPVGNR